MHSGKHNTPPDLAPPKGDRHSITLQVFSGFINAVRESSKIHTMVNHYR